MNKAKRYKSPSDIAQQTRHRSFLNRLRGVPEWAGAGVIITANKDRSYWDSDIVVHTSYAQVLSWLIEQLGYTILGEIIRKYEFYGNLATAAIRYQHSRMSAEQLSKLTQQEQENLARFLNSNSTKFQQLVVVDNYGCQVNCSASDEDSPEGLLMAVLQEAERMLNEYYVKLFVYGTLMKGESNHLWLDSVELLGQDEVQNAQMFDLGAYPMMLSGKGIVRGELYHVPLKTVLLLDELEGHPNYFHREFLMLKSGTEALVYLGKKESILEYPLISSGQWRDRF